MGAPLWFVSIAALLAFSAADVLDDCQLVGGDKKSAGEQAVLAKLAPLKGKRFEAKTKEGSDDYKYSFVVCGRLSNDSKSTNEGLVQSKEGSTDTSVIGRINDTHIISGTDWILLIYGSGDKYDTHCNSEARKAMVMISCSKKTLGGDFTVVQEERNKSRECFYLFEMDSSLACPPEESHLSVGSILLIDGCDFVCRSRPRTSDTAYRGVGDDQLAEEPEERDDHLLPM
ncbi:hypothetical protein XELAEV_18036687mg [Xenopus laevis]|uniref:Cation-dependent mannose-6-phosphate receptor n=1 Tax=Xenopus laevis TaxID=8355 RepID=A0A974CAY0_XENLA|nr:hypothetical protein XELAEV_18036687mg [Xenopus laevis]